MYTNELLEEKYKAQRQLAEKAVTEKKDYFEIVNEEVQNLFNRNAWEMKLYNKQTIGENYVS
jgi:hypothetical protein